MRYTDADSLLNDFLEIPQDYFSIADILFVIEHAYTADVVPVVRCKDCKYGEIDDMEFPDQYFCKHNGCDWNNGDHFCSYGDRKS